MNNTGNLSYKVVKKGNGKFAPRVYMKGYGGLWFRYPHEFDTLEEAVAALKDYIAELEEKIKLNSEEVVFEMD